MKTYLHHLLAVAAGALTVAPLIAQAADTSGGLEEVVITAQKRTERLQDVPVSAAVISADTIDLSLIHISEPTRPY